MYLHSLYLAYLQSAYLQSAYLHTKEFAYYVLRNKGINRTSVTYLNLIFEA